MNAKTADVLEDLRGVVRIAKAASVGVTGNGPRIERAEAGIAAVAELIEAVKAQQDFQRRWDASGAIVAEGVSVDRRLAAALARCTGAA